MIFIPTSYLWHIKSEDSRFFMIALSSIIKNDIDFSAGMYILSSIISRNLHITVGIGMIAKLFHDMYFDRECNAWRGNKDE